MLKLTRAENEVAGRDFVAERFADLANAERHLSAGGALNVREVDENALRGFRAEIQLVFRVFGYALERFEHQVEFADIGEIAAAAVGAADVSSLM